IPNEGYIPSLSLSVCLSPLMVCVCLLGLFPPMVCVCLCVFMWCVCREDGGLCKHTQMEERMISTDQMLSTHPQHTGPVLVARLPCCFFLFSSLSLSLSFPFPLSLSLSLLSPIDR